MNKIYKLLAVFMLFAALSAGSMTVQADETDAVAQIGETTYPSLAAAITNAGTATAVEIDLLAAVELTDAITINSNVTLDLNGCTLTTSSSISVALGGNVVDNSEAKSGRLILGENATVDWTSNSQVPVYDGTGYAFATMTEQVYRKSDMGADTFELIFKPDFGALNDLMAKGSIATNVDIGVNLEWTDADGAPKTAQLVYNVDMDAMVQTVYTANSGKAFLLTATGANSFDNLTITPMVKSELGTEWSDSEFKAGSTETGDGVYYAHNFEDSDISSLNAVKGCNKIYVQSALNTAGTNTRAKIQIAKDATDKWVYVQPTFDEVVSNDNMIIELNISRSTNKVAKILLQYPYAMTEEPDGSISYSLNTLMTMTEGNNSIWTMGLDNTQVGEGTGGSFAFKINLATGGYTAYKKDSNGEYVQLGTGEFTGNPLSMEFQPEFIKLYFEKTNSEEGLSYIDNFAVYAGTEFKASEGIPWNQ